MILITGGTGMLGAHLIEQMHQQGILTRAIYRTVIPPTLAHAAEWFKADILDVVALEEAMEGVSHVYHCAGYVSFNAKDKKELHRVNIEGTANIVNACLDAGVEKLVHVSSVAALGRIRPGQMINESMNWTEDTSNSEYGKTKYLGEVEVWRGVGEGLNAVIINPSIIIGRHGDWEKGSMAIFKNIYKGFPWYSTGGTGFVDADDIVRVMMQLMNSDINAERFVVSAENRSYKDLFFMIADSFGKKRPQKLVTPFLAAVVWRLEKVKSWFTHKDPLVTKETAATALAIADFDNSKLLKALPNFSYTPLPQSVESICKSLVKRYTLS
ncbi:MAG: NAD-dependent epimerase/dehydratase family protein [Chitinophagaceae bacterium]